MVSICFYFQVHQPFRLRKYTIFDIGQNKDYFDEKNNLKLNNEAVLRKVANKCYLPANKLMLDLLNKHQEFKVSYSLSGTALEQMEKFYPEVLESFKKLVGTGKVELLSETYYHSLAFLYSKKEFKEQINLHKEKLWDLFAYKPKVFRNTELIYNNEIAKFVEGLGYKAILAEGWDHVLGWKSPNFVYKPKDCSKIKLLLKNYKLSDDIAFRFSECGWEEWPLTAEKYAQWVNAINGNGECVNLFMDYETLGEHQWHETGIFDFIAKLPEELLKHADNDFKTPSELANAYQAKDEIDVPHLMSWADLERDVSAWLGNKMQQESLQKIYSVEKLIKKSKDKEVIDTWRKLQTSDHFYYMCTKWFADGDVHKYFNPYDSPYDSFITFMNVMNDMMLRLQENKRGGVNGEQQV